MARKRFKIGDSEAEQIVLSRVDIRGERGERRALDRAVLRNRAFFFGRHHYVEENGRLRPMTTVPAGTVFYKANFVRPDVLRAMLTVSGANADFVVAPTKNTKDAKYAAWCSEKLLGALQERVRMLDLDQLATLIAAIDGSAIWRCDWNPDLGPAQRFYYANKAGTKVYWGDDLDGDERRRLEDEEMFEDFHLGDVDCQVGPLWGFWWDWTARRDLTEASWAAEGMLVDYDYIEQRYGPKALEGINPEVTPQGSLYYNELVSFLAATPTYAGYGQTLHMIDEKRGRQAPLVTLIEKPMPSNGNMGRKIVWAGGKVLENKENPYRKLEYTLPWVKQDFFRFPGRFWGGSLVEDLISPQSNYNKMRASMVEHVRVFGHPAIFLPPNSGIPTGQYTVQPGSVWEKKNPQRIETGPTPQLPKEVIESLQMARNEISDISSQASIEGSKLPGQLRSASAVDLMFEERNKMLSHPALNFVEAKRQVGRQMLALAHRFYDEERTVHYLGEGREYRALKFKGADVNYDLRIIVDRSRLMESPATSRARVMEMVQLGIVDPINNPEDKEAVFKVLEFGNVSELVADRLQEEENQEREIDEMLANPFKWMAERADMMAPEQDGMPTKTRGYPLNPYDDHAAHLRVLRRFLRSTEGRKMDPYRQSVVMQHYQAHEAEVQRLQMQMMMMQAMTQGAPGQKGRASQPRQAAAAQ